MTQQIDSPVSLPAKLLSRGGHSPDLMIITGPSGAGKSTTCLRLAAEARSAKLITAGLISKPIFHHNRKVAIDLVDQHSFECRRLAVLRDEAKMGIETKQWSIDPGVLQWANQRLLDRPVCDLLFIDELGPLEFQRGCGLQAGLDLIDNRQIPLIIAVIRPSLISLAYERWPWGTVLPIHKVEPAVGGWA